LLSTAFFSCVPGFFMVLAIFLQDGFGLTALQSGITTVPFSVGVLLSSLISGRLGIRWPRSRITAGAAAMALAMVWLRLLIGTVGDEVGATELLPPLLIAGLGLGSAVAPMFQAILANVHGRDAGSASGSLQAFQQMGGGIGVAIMGQVFFSHLAGGIAVAAGGNPHPAFIGSIMTALWYNIIVLAAVAACAWLLAKPNFAHQPAAQPAPAD
jgi:MFS family permease